MEPLKHILSDRLKEAEQEVKSSVSKRRGPAKTLHSKEHLLADDLSKALLEPKRFASYLGIALRYRESDLRALARRVVEKVDLPPSARGRYFFASLAGLIPKVTKKTNKSDHKASEKPHGTRTTTNRKKSKKDTP